MRDLQQYAFFDNFVGFAALLIMTWSWRVPDTLH